MADDTRRHEAAQKWDKARLALAQLTLLISHAKQDREKFWHEQQLLPHVREDGKNMTIPQVEATISLHPIYQKYSEEIRKVEINRLKLQEEEWKLMRAFEHEESLMYHNLAIEKGERFTPNT